MNSYVLSGIRLKFWLAAVRFDHNVPSFRSAASEQPASMHFEFEKISFRLENDVTKLLSRPKRADKDGPYLCSGGPSCERVPIAPAGRWTVECCPTLPKNRPSEHG